MFSGLPAAHRVWNSDWQKKLRYSLRLKFQIYEKETQIFPEIKVINLWEKKSQIFLEIKTVNLQEKILDIPWY